MDDPVIEEVLSFSIQLPHDERLGGIAMHLLHLAGALRNTSSVAEILDIVTEQQFDEDDLVWTSTVTYRAMV